MPRSPENPSPRRVPRGRPRFVDGERARRASRALSFERALEKMARTLRALGDPTRAKVVLALSVEELCVGDLARLLRASPSVVSHQLRVLRDLDLVRCRRQGRVAYYALDDAHVRRLFEEGIERARKAGARRRT